MSLERLLANEHTENLRGEARMWQLEKRLFERPERRFVIRRVVALLGRRRSSSSARGGVAVGTVNEIEEQVDWDFAHDDPTSEREDPTFGGCETEEALTKFKMGSGAS